VQDRPTVQSALRDAAARLATAGVASPRVDAELLLAWVLGVARSRLILLPSLPPAAVASFEAAVARRAAREPLQHIVRAAPFLGLSLAVGPGVFIPRPETEVLVDVALERIEVVAAPVVVDVCTGTGAIALAIAQERPDARVVASDVSAEAAALARQNAHALDLAVDVREGDLLEAVEGPLDLVTCNPPYVPARARETLPREVLADPALALFGGPDIVARLFAEAFERLRPGGWVVVEIEESTGEEIRGLATEAGYVDVTERLDLAGRPRVVAARRP
jgi:release factor glutamine methyltransferase